MVLNRLLQRIGVKEAMAARDEEREDRRIDRAEFRSEHEKMMAGVAYEKELSEALRLKKSSKPFHEWPAFAQRIDTAARLVQRSWRDKVMRKYRADLTKALDGPVNEADDGPALVNAGWGWTWMQVTSEMCKRKDRGKKAKQRHSQSVRKPAPDDGHGNGGGSAGSDDLGGQVVEEEEEGEEEEGGMESGASDGNATGGRASSDCQRRTTKATHFARASPHSTRTHAYETKVKPRPATAAAKPMASAARVAEEPKQRALSASQFKSSPDLRKAGAEASHSSERHQPARAGTLGEETGRRRCLTRNQLPADEYRPANHSPCDATKINPAQVTEARDLALGARNDFYKWRNSYWRPNLADKNSLPASDVHAFSVALFAKWTTVMKLRLFALVGDMESDSARKGAAASAISFKVAEVGSSMKGLLKRADIEEAMRVFHAMGKLVGSGHEVDCKLVDEVDYWLGYLLDKLNALLRNTKDGESTDHFPGLRPEQSFTHNRRTIVAQGCRQSLEMPDGAKSGRSSEDFSMFVKGRREDMLMPYASQPMLLADHFAVSSSARCMGPLVSPVAAAGQHTGDFCASDTSPHSRPTSSRMSLDLAVPLPATSGGPSTRQSLDSFLQAHAANSRSMAGQRPGLQQSVTAGSPSLKETVVSLRRESSETGRVSDYPVKASNRVHWGMELHQKSRGSMSSRGVVSSRGARDGRRSLDLSATSRTAGSPMPRHPGRAVTAGSSCPMRKSLDNSSLLASSSSYHLSWGTVDSVPQAQGTASTMMPRSEKSCPSLNGLSMTSEPLLSNEPASTMAVRSGRSCYSLKVLHATQAPSASHDSMRLRSAKVSATTSSTLVSSELVGSYAAGKVQTAITRAKPSTSFLG